MLTATRRVRRATEDDVQIIPDDPRANGSADGARLGGAKIAAAISKSLKGPYLKDSLGAMSRRALSAGVMARLQTPPDYGQFPELEDLYPERVDYIRGLALGAECSLEDAAMYSYLVYRNEIDHWYHLYQLKRSPGHCSGVILIGPDGVLGAQSVESGPPRMPARYQPKLPARPAPRIRMKRPRKSRLVLRRPRTGYIEDWGTTNERGVGPTCGASCSVWLDEPIEDVWPVAHVPLLRFATNIDHLAQLVRRYNLHNWGRQSAGYADTNGNAMIVEKSFRRVGIRMIGDASVLWCTEGHFESPEMNSYMRSKRLEYVEKMGRHLGCGDMQYASDSAVRFANLGELCHRPWGRGVAHMHKILTDHSPFPRAICRHAGPDTAPYDKTVTLESRLVNLTHNRRHLRKWEPWKRFCCEVPEEVVQYPTLP